MADQEPDWVKAFAEAGAKLGEGLKQTGRILSAQGAMGWAFRGDLDQLSAVLAVLPAEQVREISAAAALLTSAADDVLRERPVQ
ncbi:hypothetical protein [Sphaerisporangium sp. NPDC051011]|uniref:hypothetical protein n=1 Tax=Sphaerisporangium sp. NPDC051011 TaxID=3155792 RepID=UPI0033ECC01A